MLKIIDIIDRYFIYKYNKNINFVKYLMIYDLEFINMLFKVNCGYLYIFQEFYKKNIQWNVKYIIKFGKVLMNL